MIILKKFLEKKHWDGKVKQFYSAKSFLQKSMSSTISSNVSGSIPTIMYIAALVLIGLTPFIELSLINAASAAAFSFAFSPS